MPTHPPNPGSHQGRGREQRKLRIIGGQWRGRRFRFPPVELRPTPDRVRETLFNWLQSRILGAHCLDLYAGSGALGLEALSRGAAAVSFVEQQRVVTVALERLLLDWQATGASVICDQAQHFLAAARTGSVRRRFDLVFLDPPFGSGELAAVTAALDRGWLAPDSRIYLERARSEPLPALPAHWRELREGSAGEVRYHLFEPGAAST